MDALGVVNGETVILSEALRRAKGFQRAGKGIIVKRLFIKLKAPVPAPDINPLGRPRHVAG